MYEEIDVKLWNSVCNRALYHAKCMLEPGYKVSAEEANAAAALIHAAVEITRLTFPSSTVRSAKDSAWFR